MAGELTSGVDRQSFRDAMSRLGSAVHVVTSDGVAGRLGLTASAVCSVSDTPATLLMCINRNSKQNEPLKRNGVFCVNSLAGNQRQFSDMFAGFAGIEMHDRFKQGSWHQLATGSPVLEGAVISFDCRISSFVQVATHTLVVGEVMAIRSGPTDTPALIYFERQYHSVHGQKDQTPQD